MHKITPKHLAVFGCLAMACGSAGTPDAAAPQVQETRAEFAPQGNSKTRSKASATLQKTGKPGQTIGTLNMVQKGDWVTINGNLRRLPAGEHGIQIRAEGDCDQAVKSSSEHYNPTDSRHGPPDSSRRHVGDLGNIDVDRNGKGTFSMRTNSMTLIEDGPSSVLGRTVVITKNKDNGRSQPSGDAGPVIACGVIKSR